MCNYIWSLSWPTYCNARRHPKSSYHRTYTRSCLTYTRTQTWTAWSKGQLGSFPASSGSILHRHFIIYNKMNIITINLILYWFRQDIWRCEFQLGSFSHTQLSIILDLSHTQQHKHNKKNIILNIYCKFQLGSFSHTQLRIILDLSHTQQHKHNKKNIILNIYCKKIYISVGLTLRSMINIII